MNVEKFVVVVSVGVLFARLNTRAFSVGFVAKPKPSSRVMIVIVVIGVEVMIVSSVDRMTSLVMLMNSVWNGRVLVNRSSIVIPMNDLRL